MLYNIDICHNFKRGIIQFYVLQWTNEKFDLRSHPIQLKTHLQKIALKKGIQWFSKCNFSQAAFHESVDGLGN